MGRRRRRSRGVEGVGERGGGETHLALKNKSHNKILWDQDSTVTATVHQPIPRHSTWETDTAAICCMLCLLQVPISTKKFKCLTHKLQARQLYLLNMIHGSPTDTKDDSTQGFHPSCLVTGMHQPDQATVASEGYHTNVPVIRRARQWSGRMLNEEAIQCCQQAGRHWTMQLLSWNIYTDKTKEAHNTNSIGIQISEHSLWKTWVLFEQKKIKFVGKKVHFVEHKHRLWSMSSKCSNYPGHLNIQNEFLEVSVCSHMQV